MRHLDHAELAEIALGEMDDGQSPLSRHLGECVTCRTELEELHRVVVAARSMSADDVLAPPPERVWEAISAELGLDSAPGDLSDEEPDATASAVRTDPAVDARARRPRLAEVPPAGLPGAEGSEPASSRPTRRRRFAILLAAACLVAGAALGSATTWWQLRGDDAAAAATGRGSSLKPLAAGDAQGVARLANSDGGSRQQLRIDVEGLPGTDGYFEVWLMDPTHKKLIAIGVLGPRGSATLPLPKGVNLADYPLVDVSDQEYNGDPAHSGNSVVRGLLKR